MKALILPILLLSLVACRKEDPTRCYQCRTIVTTHKTDGTTIAPATLDKEVCGTEADAKHYEANGTRTETNEYGTVTAYSTSCK